MLLKILAVEIKQPYMIKLDENSPQLFKTGSNLAWQTYTYSVGLHVVIGLIEFEDYDTLLHGFHGMMCLPAEPLNIVPSSRPFLTTIPPSKALIMSAIHSILMEFLLIQHAEPLMIKFERIGPLLSLYRTLL